MGSLQLDCPLCCDEIFDDLQSLKYHLLSIIDNILCPACGSRFQTILELAEHFDHECGQTSEEENALDSNIIKIEKVDSYDDNLNNSILAKALLNPKINTKDKVNNKSNETQIENNALSKENAETVQEITIEENGTEQEEEVYSCLGCGMSFTNIVEHIQEHHDGEEVIVEMAENLNENNDNNDLLKSLTDGSTIIAEENIETVMLSEWEGAEDDDDITSQSTDSQEIVEVSNRSRLPQLLNTIKQEDCVDKDGRLYTRKVVQIEKFWDDNKNKTKSQKPNKAPLIVKYVTDSDGTLHKIKDGVLISEGIDVIEIYQCRICNVQFHKRDQFDNHTCDPEIGSEYKCSMCAFSFTNSQSLCAHMKSHKKAKSNYDTPPTGPFICQVCDTEFITNKSLRLHRRMHDPIKSKEIDPPVHYGLTGTEPKDLRPREMFECKVCGKSYDKSYEEIHMAYHSGTNNHDCYICNRKFYTASNLEMHMRVHGSEKGHLCKHCKKGFLTEESLAQHLKQHCSTRPYQCSYCSRRFARPHEKVKHERIHTGEKPHECEICGKTFRVSYCLTLHMRTHSGYRPYVCQHCGKRFKAHSVYNHHLLTHSDVRNYKCPYCPKAFKTGVQLAGHKNSHTKPFSCTVCNRPFASLYAVRAHMETHSRENNLKYNCYLCGASYARAFALRDHIKEVHVDAPQNENIALDIIEEGYDASSSILPDNDDISIVTLEMASSDDVNEVTEMELETAE